ncbi:MAG: Acyl carrier protein, partial [uncultured Thermomicrobiales bacterium]
VRGHRGGKRQAAQDHRGTVGCRGGARPARGALHRGSQRGLPRSGRVDHGAGGGVRRRDFRRGCEHADDGWHGAGLHHRAHEL